MCWGQTASLAMVGLGAVATVVTVRRGAPRAIPATLGYFTLMEALQAAGYVVVDQCGSPANQTITLLSYLHIVFQPFFINALALELVPRPVRLRTQTAIYTMCGLSAAVMLLQVYPFDWAGTCREGTVLCGATLCTVSGNWHIAWDIPYNGLLNGLESSFGQLSFPTYLLSAFLLPLLYGAWRFVVFHAAIGPFLASLLTDNPNELPAIWCLFSIGIILISLSPLIRQRFETSTWYGFPVREEALPEGSR